MNLQTDKSSEKNKGSPTNQKEKQVNQKTKKGDITKKIMPGIMGRFKGRFVFNEKALDKMHKDMLADID